MSEELVQVVDENDHPLKGATKKEIHDHGWFYRVARVMIEDGQGNVLLQKRASSKSLFPNRWDNSVAGHVAEGEPYETSAVRETGEEVGIQEPSLIEIGYYRSTHIDNRGVRCRVGDDSRSEKFSPSQPGSGDTRSCRRARTILLR